LLAELSVLFTINGHEDDMLKARILRKFYNRTFEYEGNNYDPYFIREIQNLYGGNGSFFDTYIGDFNSPDFRNPESNMYKAAERFDVLIDQLYEECANLRTKKQSSYSEENEYKENKEQEDEKE
jgi:hypothetical protein